MPPSLFAAAMNPRNDVEFPSDSRPEGVKPRPFMQSDGDTPLMERRKSRMSSKSAAYVRRESSHASSVVRNMSKGRTTSLNENIWKGTGGNTTSTADIVPEHLKPKRTQTQPGLRSMLYGLTMKM